MDEVLLKQLVKQLKLLNFWISFFGAIIVISLIALGILLFKVITYTQQVSSQISETRQSLQQSTDVKSQLCRSDSIASRYTSICN